MKKSSFSENVRVSRIKTLLEREELKQKDLADMLDIEPQNLSRCLCSGKVSDKMCRNIGDHFPKYNVMWLLGDSDIMLTEEIRQDISSGENSVCPLTISIGYSKYKADENYHSCLDRADKALYYAKKHGRNQVVDYTSI